MKRIAIVLAAIVAALSFSTPSASAGGVTCDDTYTGSALDALCWPVEPGRTVVIDGPRNVWKMRTFGEVLDAGSGLNVVSGSCSFGQPGVFCVEVVKSYQPNGRYAGLTMWNQPAYQEGVVITLNTSIKRATTKQRVAAHELMHAVGFDHHGEVGVIGSMGTGVVPSSNEWSALRSTYGL